MTLLEHPLYQQDLQLVASIEGLRQEMVGKRILITGASGLMGSFLVDVLLWINKHEKNHFCEVNALGRNNERLMRRFSYARGALQLLAQDIVDAGAALPKVDYIIHAASNADPHSFVHHPIDTILANTQGTYNLLEHVRKYGGRLLLISSREVYGLVTGSAAYPEEAYGLIDYNTLRAGYPESKRVAELLCRNYTYQYDVDSVIARLGYVYGPTVTAQDSRASAQFLRAAAAGQDIPMTSEGVPRRSYTHVADAADGLFRVLLNGRAGEAYNVANQKAVVSLRELAELAAKSGGSKVVRINPDSEERRGASNVQDAVLDDRRLRELGWCPRYDVKEGISRTVEIMHERGTQWP